MKAPAYWASREAIPPIRTQRPRTQRPSNRAANAPTLPVGNVGHGEVGRPGRGSRECCPALGVALGHQALEPRSGAPIGHPCIAFSARALPPAPARSRGHASPPGRSPWIASGGRHQPVWRPQPGAPGPLLDRTPAGAQGSAGPTNRQAHRSHGNEPARSIREAGHSAARRRDGARGRSSGLQRRVPGPVRPRPDGGRRRVVGSRRGCPCLRRPFRSKTVSREERPPQRLTSVP
jgi:hypothetical protein